MTPDPKKPPRKARRLLRGLTDYQETFGIVEDMDAAYHETGRELGWRRARLWYWKECLSAIPKYLAYRANWSFFMLKNYWKTSIRNIRRQKVFSAVNILGLSLGLACCVLVFQFVADELSFDRFHDKAGSIYALVCRNEFHNQTTVGASMGTGPVLERDFPEIERAVRLVSRTQATARYGDKIFNETPLFVDPGFFEVFTFPLIAGRPQDVLRTEGGIVLTEGTARKYFGQRRGLGETLSLAFGDIRKDFTVSGICQDPPGNSSIRFEILINVDNLRDIQGPEFLTNFRWMDTMIFVLLKDDASPETINAHFPAFIRQYFQETMQRYRDSGSWKKEGDVLSLRLVNIRKLHLSPEIRSLGARSIESSLILAGIGLLILVIACINFVNLSLGRASVRTLEVGLRKVLGARRKQLFHQFWTEAFVLSFLALAAGILIAVLVLPLFNSLAEKNLRPGALFTAANLLVFLAILAAVAVASGSFPGLFLSRLEPVDVLKSRTRRARRKLLPGTLVVIQFGLAVFLLVMTFTMARQFRFVSRADLGFDEEGIIIVDLQEEGFERGPQSEELIERFRNRLTASRPIQSISGCIMNNNRLMVMSHIDVNGKVTGVFVNRVTHDYLKTMGIKLQEGRDFSREYANNASSVIVNRAFVKRFELENPLGRTIYDANERDRPLTIIGVADDYHFQSLQYAVAPIILHMVPDITIRDMLVRVYLNDIPGAIKALNEAWEALRPGKPFLYSFMDQEFGNSYARHRRWMRIVVVSTLLAVFISTMGIFAMTVISISRRVREIGIRRILGAGSGSIVGLVSREFLPLVAAANIVAWPFAFAAARRWLQGFSYRADLSPAVFVFALGMSLLVALATVGVLTFQAALANPARSLRAE